MFHCTWSDFAMAVIISLRVQDPVQVIEKFVFRVNNCIVTDSWRYFELFTIYFLFVLEKTSKKVNFFHPGNGFPRTVLGFVKLSRQAAVFLLQCFFKFFPTVVNACPNLDRVPAM